MQHKIYPPTLDNVRNDIRQQLRLLMSPDMPFQGLDVPIVLHGTHSAAWEQFEQIPLLCQ